jgi:uncharacterized protein YraI
MKFELPPPLPDEATIQRQRREKRQSAAQRANKAELEGHPNRAGSIHNRADARSMPPPPSGDSRGAGNRPLPVSSKTEGRSANQSQDDSGTDWSFLREKAERPANSKDVSSASKKKRQHAFPLIAVGMLIVAVSCWLWWNHSHPGTSTLQSPGSAGNAAQPVPGNPSEAEPNPTSSPNADSITQPSAQPAGTVASVATPSPASSPNSNTNAQRATHPTKVRRPHSEEGSSSTTISSNSPTPAPSVTTSPSPASEVTQGATPSSTPVLRRAAMVYEVVGISSGDYLNVRSGGGSTFPIVGRLAPGTGDISSTGAIVKNGETTWLRISVGKLSGWVNSDFLKPAGQKDASPSQTNQESTAQNQTFTTPQGSEAEQRARYWAEQGYHFDPNFMSAIGMDLEVQRLKGARQ